MPRSFPCLVAACVLFLSLAAGGVDKPPQKQDKSFETVLTESGFVLIGSSYILKDTEERDQKLLPLRPVAGERDQWRSEIRWCQTVIERHATRG